MAKSPIPWSIKGIDPDTRAIAKEKAREAGMTLGEWLSHTIAQGEAQAAKSEAQETKGQTTKKQAASQADKASDGPDTASTAAMSQPITGITLSHLKELVDSVNRLNERIRVTERNSRETANGLNLGLTSVMERIKRIEARKAEATTAGAQPGLSTRNSVDTLVALEKALRQVVAQFEQASAATMERVSANEQRVQKLEDRVQVMDAETNATFTHLRRMIDEINGQIQQTEKTARAVMLQARAAAKSTDPEFVAQTGEQLRILGAEIKRSGDQIQNLEGLIAKLSDKIEASEYRSSEGIKRVSSTLEVLREEIKQFDASEEEEGDRLEAQTAIANASETASNRMEALQKNFTQMVARLEGVVDSRKPSAQSAPKQAALQTAPPAETSTSVPSAVSADNNPPDLSLDDLPAAAPDKEETPLKKAMQASEDLLELDDDDEFETIFTDEQEPSLPDGPPEPLKDPDEMLSALTDGSTEEPQTTTTIKNRRALTAKQKQILAARARRKRLEEEHKGSDNTPRDDDEPDHGPVYDDDAPQGQDADHAISEEAVETDDDIEQRESRFEAIKRKYGQRSEGGLPIPLTALIGLSIVAVLALAWFLLKDSFNGPQTPPPTPSENMQEATPGPQTPPDPAPVDADMAAARTAFNQGTSLLDQAATIERTALSEGRALTPEEQADINQKLTTAFPLIRRAAARHYPPAEQQLGEMLMGGIGTEQNLPAARQWFQSAAENGNVLAMHKLGALSVQGIGGETNRDAALHWFEQAAERGYADSMFNLGLLYVPQLLLEPGEELDPTYNVDPGKSYFWLSLAGSRGDEDAATTAKEVASLLTPETREQIDQKVAEWTAKPIDPNANIRFRLQ